MKQLLMLAFAFIVIGAAAQDGGAGITLIQETKAQETQDDPIFQIVELMPVFPEGEGKMYQFIGTQVRYPAEAKDQNIEGTVYTQFIINKDGCIDTSSIKILRSVHPSLDNEAMRVVRQMPCWTPGYQNEKPVRVYYKLPFRFTLKD